MLLKPLLMLQTDVQSDASYTAPAKSSSPYYKSHSAPSIIKPFSWCAYIILFLLSMFGILDVNFWLPLFFPHAHCSQLCVCILLCWALIVNMMLKEKIPPQRYVTSQINPLNWFKLHQRSCTLQPSIGLPLRNKVGLLGQSLSWNIKVRYQI